MIATTANLEAPEQTNYLVAEEMTEIFERHKINNLTVYGF